MAEDLEAIFGRALFELRRERGLSQEQLGFASGLHRTYISQLERGLKTPTLRVLFQLATALGAPAALLVQRVEERYQGSAAREP